MLDRDVCPFKFLPKVSVDAMYTQGMWCAFKNALYVATFMCSNINVGVLNREARNVHIPAFT